MKKIYIATMLILGSYIGAGFCSGKEVAIYFANYGFYSLFFVPIFFVLNYFMFKFFLNLGNKNQNKTFGDLNKDIFFKGGLLNFLMILVCLIFSSAMYAGLFEISNIFDSTLVKYILIICIVTFTFVILLRNFSAFKNLNSILTPFILFTIILCSVVSLKLNSDFNFVFKIQNGFLMFFNPIIYACQGLTINYYIWAKAGEDLNKKQINSVAFFSSFILCLIISLTIIVFNFEPELLTQSMPFASLSFKFGFPLDILFSIVIILAILTSLLGTTRCLHDILILKISNKFLRAFLSAIVPILFSFIGFSKIITYLYPLVGCIGFILFILIILKQKNSHHNKNFLKNKI